MMLGLRRMASGEIRGKAECCALLREFIVAYGVCRVFAGMREDNAHVVLASIVEHLQQQPTAAVLSSIERVDALTDATESAGFHRLISFASKALNMLGQRVPLYSSEGLAYLGLKQPASYEAFHAAWTQAYEPLRAAYESAAAKHLQRDGSSSSLESSLGAEWFAMRGFDVRLLRVGGPMRSAGGKSKR